jgi:hypothetical protein
MHCLCMHLSSFYHIGACLDIGLPTLLLEAFEASGVSGYHRNELCQPRLIGRIRPCPVRKKRIPNHEVPGLTLHCLRKHTYPFFECFPYVCPEPVLPK